MSHVSPDGVRNIILEWIASNALEPIDTAALDDATDLVEAGVLDSFAIIDLIVHLEASTGRKIDVTSIDPEEFTTLGGLARHAAAS